VAAFIEQVQNIEKSKASLLEVVSCFATAKARIKTYISSQVKSALRKFSEGKDHNCDSFMSDVSSGHRLIWWGEMRYRFAMNPMVHKTILHKSITFTYVHLRGNKSKLGLEEALMIKLVKL